MNKLFRFIFAAIILACSFVIGHALTTTMSDIFAVGYDSSGGPLLRIASDGGIFTAGASTLSGATTLSGGATLSGTNTISGATTVSGQATFSVAPVIPVVDVTVTTPTAVGQIVRASAQLAVVYVSTGTTSFTQWIKVGGQ